MLSARAFAFPIVAIVLTFSAAGSSASSAKAARSSTRRSPSGSEAVSASSENLIRNPGFETDANGDGMPDDWTFSWKSTHQADAARGIEKQKPDSAWDKDIKHSGAAAVRCGVARPVDDGVWSQDGIPVPAGAKAIRLTAWIRAQGVKNTMGSVGLVFLTQDGKFLKADYTTLSADRDQDWTLHTGYVEVPKGAATMRVRCWANFRYTGVGTFWFDDVGAVVSDHMVFPTARYVDDAPPVNPTPEERVRGFVLFTRNYLRLLFPDSHPQSAERVEKLAVRACPGEREPATISVSALRDLQSVEVASTDLKGPGASIPASAVDIRSVRFHPKRGQSRWGPFNQLLMTVPLFLEKRDDLTIAAGSLQPFWLTVHVPEGTPPGTYRGKVSVKVDGAAPALWPLEVEVHPFALAEPRGIGFGVYERQRSSPDWIADSFADMRAHGLTTVGLYSNCGLDMRNEDGKAVVHFAGESEFERALDAYARAGFPESPVWLMSGDVHKFCLQFGPFDSEPFADALRALVEQISARGRERGWPEILYQPVDEPFEASSRLDLALNMLRILKTIPGVRTEEDGMNGAWSRFYPQAYPLTDVLTLHDGPTIHRGQIDMKEWTEFREQAEADGKTLWFYNIDLTGWHPEPMRYMYGFGLWRSKATGVIEWVYMGGASEADPGRVYSNPDALMYRFPKAPGESGGPTIGYEAMREGIDDYRYLLTLRQAVDDAEKSGSKERAALAESLWRPVQAKLDEATLQNCCGPAGEGDWTGPCQTQPDGNQIVRGDHKIDNGWTFDDYDALRSQIAAAIVQLEAPEKNTD